MPKLKTNKAAKKRFKVTAKGKVLRMRTKRRHLLTDKSGSEKRSLRRWGRVDKTDEKRFRALLPYR
jgi:large subunit ribosomal protein L35